MEKKLEAALLKEYKKFLGEEVEENHASGLEIRVLGPSCRACDKVYRDTKTVLAELGKAADLEHIRDLKEIGRYGMMATPALIVNGKVKSSGKIPSKKQLKKWLEEA